MADRPAVHATRRRIVELLRREPLTIGALAQRLGLTASAVRVHVTGLERDGFLRRAGVERGLNRPAAIYEVAPRVDTVLCAAYVPFVANLLKAAGDGLGARQLAALMRRTGRRFAADYPRPAGALPRRTRAASTILNALGALAVVDVAADRLVIRSYDCPLASAVASRPEACRALESFVSELVQAPVRERCDRRGRPRCRLEIERRPPSSPTATRGTDEHA